MLTAGGALRAQHYVGVRGGYGSGSVRFFPPTETGTLWGLYNGGISWKFYSREKYLGGLEADLQFIQKGYTQPEPGRPDTVYSHWVNSIELPFFWQPHVYVLNRSMRVYLNLGVVFSYNLDASEALDSKRNGPLYEKRPYEMILVRDNKWGYGLCGGLGINYITGRFEWMAEARYNFGYSDIYKNKTVYPPNPYQRSPLDNFYLSTGVYFRLGKEGIRSLPSEGAARKLNEREARRVARQAEAQAKKPAEEKPSAEPAEESGAETPSGESSTPPAPKPDGQPEAPQAPGQPAVPTQTPQQPGASR